MKQHDEIKLLEQLIYKEEKKLISSYPADNFQKKIILFSLLKDFDTYHLFTNDKDKYRHHYEFGWLKALVLIYGDYVNEEKYPLFKSEEKMLGFAHWFIISAGQIEFCRKIIDFINAGLATAYLNEKKIIVEFNNIGVKEEFDRDTFHWVRNLVHEHICSPEIKKILKEVEIIRKKMRPLVDKWRVHYIQYDTTPEIDNVFEKFAYYQLFAFEEKEEFGQDSLFGGILYSKYCEFVKVVCGIALKHYYFCLELYDKYKGEINFPDIITITKDREGFIQSISNYLDVTVNDSEQLLDSLTLCPENIGYHSRRFRPVPSPYVKIADNSLVQSIVGSQSNPYDFLNHELRRRYEKDYFRAVNDREKTFRNQLYNMFEENNYIKIEKSIAFKSSKGASDIDAAIYDKDSEVLGIFQLKWQEMYGASMKERYSRITNLYPKTVEWIDKVETWINESDPRDELKKFGVNCKRSPIKVLLFVICRHAAFFTGNEPDKRAAWSSVWLILKIFSRMPRGIPNKLKVLHDLVHQEYSAVSNAKQDLDGESFIIGEYEVYSKFAQ
ncbi:MAG: hypothetical protein PHS64_02195 [Candidatus Omnitrophica bacterium]|nr:hypothetical protein [Candidatus Omnitrophota bacterium]